MYDLIIIGGGAAGIMSSISAKRKNPNLSVLIIDRTFALGRKILVCGAGRCNITNLNLNNSLSQRYYADINFVQSVFDQFGFNEIKSFFNDLGIELYVERKTNIGKLFPVTDQSKTVTSLLEDEINRLGINVVLETEVKNLEKEGDVFRINTLDLKLNTEKTFEAKKIILSAGGKTYPALGSNGSGFALAESLGHKIITPVPSALPLVSKNSLSHELQGVKMELEATSIIEGREIKKTIDDVMFTQYGFSGPAILNISREISIQLNRHNKDEVFIKLNFFPGKNENDVYQLLTERWSKRPNQTLEYSLFGIFPNKVPQILLKILGFNKDLKVKNLLENQKIDLVNSLCNFKVKITATRGWNEAEFTAGGVNTAAVKPGTLESKLVPGLYFCGEILDVDGDVGGFNLSWAWSSGFVAGLLK